MRWMLALALLATAARAQEPRPAAPEIKALHMMAGEWAVEETLEDGTRGHGSMLARVGPGGHSVIADYATITGGRTGYRMHEVLTWQPAERAYRLLRVDGFEPGAFVAAGKRAGKDVVFESGTTRVTLTVKNDDTFDVVLARGAARPLALAFTRKGPPGR